MFHSTHSITVARQGQGAFPTSLYRLMGASLQGSDPLDASPGGADSDGRDAGRNFSSIALVDPDAMLAPAEPMPRTFYMVSSGWQVGIFDDW
jgi:hypothetical protein